MPISARSTSRSRNPQALKILRAAQHVLAFQGYPLFSIRNVAKAANTSVGAVQYHFASRRMLLEELLLYVTELYERQYARVFAKSYDSPEDRFFGLIDFYLSDLSTPIRRGFFAQAWALAHTEAFAERSMERSFARYRRAVARCVHDLVGDLSEAECDAIAAAIQSLIEGAQMSQIKRGRHFVLQARVKAMIRAQAYAIATQAV